MTRFTSFERRVLIAILVCLVMTSYVWLSPGYSTTHAHPAASPAATTTYSYYGADLNLLKQATGIDPNNPTTRPNNAPWPQLAHNYCFLAGVQALVNYSDLVVSSPMSYPSQNNQGPPPANELASYPANPNASSLAGDVNPQGEQPNQILTAMDTYMTPVGALLDGSVTPKNVAEYDTTTGLWEIARSPFTLANIAHDYGGDPRSQAVAALELSAPTFDFYQHIYHNGVDAAAHALAVAVTTTMAFGPEHTNYAQLPSLAFVDQAYHVVLVAGVIADSNPATNPNANIQDFIVFNPWDQTWLNGTSYLGTYYNKVSYNDWTGASGYTHWWGHPYKPNGVSDPDPYVGPYTVSNPTGSVVTKSVSQVASSTEPPYESGVDTIYGAVGPNASLKTHHWIDNYVTIEGTNQELAEEKGGTIDSAFDENENVMTSP